MPRRSILNSSLINTNTKLLKTDRNNENSIIEEPKKEVKSNTDKMENINQILQDELGMFHSQPQIETDNLYLITDKSFSSLPQDQERQTCQEKLDLYLKSIKQLVGSELELINDENTFLKMRVKELEAKMNNQTDKLMNLNLLITKYQELQNKHESLMNENLALSHAMAEKNKLILELEQAKRQAGLF
jgi:hypothetical protein